jgi:3-phosphoshikimate 1-carboxyvinyltransferase
MKRTVEPPCRSLSGTIGIPGDKSISHRALLLSAIADGESRVEGLLRSHDVRATRDCLANLGVDIADADDGTVVVQGVGVRGLRRPASTLDCARSGTTMRLLAGLLAGRPFASLLTGDPQLLRRPMSRIVEPLARMGAQIESKDGRAPLLIHGTALRGADHRPAVASAQVKSALLLAGLTAQGATSVTEAGPSRDHTERMLGAMGADVHVDGRMVRVSSTARLDSIDVTIPGDPSSAAFWLVAGTIVPGSRLTIADVGVNPTRTGLIDVLRAMGASIEAAEERQVAGEPVSDLTVEARELRGVTVEGEAVVRMIDEFPVLAVAATQARGETVVRDAAELRKKESDRISSVVGALQRLGARIEERPDGFAVEGPTPLHGATVDAQDDHRLVMALAIGALVADGPVTIDGAERAEDSYPGFFEALEMCRRET